MKKINIPFNLIAAFIFVLNIAIGAGWAYQLSREQLEIKKSLLQNPLQNVVLALACIGNADGSLGDPEHKIIFAALHKLNIRDAAQIASFEKLIDFSKRNNLDIRQISYNIKSFNNPLLLRLLGNVGNLLIKEHGIIATHRLAMLADILDYAGIKTDSSW